MDADFKEKRRARISSQREKRWSMNSQRLEEIVGELMRPIGDLRHNFDTDLSALLEEYLTEAGLHALAADEDEDEEMPVAPAVAPNFAELALLLQQSANIYGRKVDFLYQHVLSVSEALHNSSIELHNEAPTEHDPTEESPRVRQRPRGPSLTFAPIVLQSQASSTREPVMRPPPVLPRVYLDLEPRQLTENEPQLTDYDREPIGVLADYHVAWRIIEGLLVEELIQCTLVSYLRDIPVLELLAALSARAPPPLPPPAPPSPEPPPSPDLPFYCSTPLPASLPASMPPPQLLCKRKRRINKLTDTSDPPTSIKLHISEDMLRSISTIREFSLPKSWLKKELRKRQETVLRLREDLRAQQDEYRSFPGWPPCSSLQLRSDSEDDGFFEQSSLGDSDQAADHTHHNTMYGAGAEETVPVAGHQEPETSTLQSLSAVEASSMELSCVETTVDIRAECSRVLGCLPTPASTGRPVPFSNVLRLATQPQEVSHLLLATLFLANSGNVEINQTVPLCVESLTVRLVSQSETLLDACEELS